MLANNSQHCSTLPLLRPFARSFRVVRKEIGSFSNEDGNGNQDVKKAIRLLRKTTTLHVHHAFLYISLPSLHDYDVKMPNCKFYGGRKQATTNLFFLSKLECGPQVIISKKIHLYFPFSANWNKRNKD